MHIHRLAYAGQLYAVKKTLKKPILKATRKGKASSDEVPEDTNVGGDKGSMANF